MADQPKIRRSDSWAHQCEAHAFAASREATMLAMGMGSGKSKIVVDLMANCEAEGCVLIMCPKAVLGVWRREFLRHCAVDHEVLVLEKGTTKTKAAQVDAFLSRVTSGLRVVVINYETAWREPLAKQLLSREWVAVLDESHKVKAPGGKASRFVDKLRRVSRRRVCLTGTPMPHSPLDLYGQFRFLDPRVFGTSFTRFRARYAVCDRMFPSKVLRWINQDDLASKMASLTYECRSEDVLDLPETIHETVEVSITPKARRVYDQLEADFVAEVDDGVVTAANALVKLLRLQQVTSGFVTDEDGGVHEVCDAKRQSLLELVDCVPADEPFVVFCRFRSDLDAARDVAAKLGRAYGELSGVQRDLTEHATMPEGFGVYGVQIQSGGVGIDLTRAAYAAYYSLGYSLGDYLQSLARLHRPGQERCVRFYHLIATKTVDAAVYKALAAREAVVDSILRSIQNANPQRVA